jgi:hypothetical protein
MPFDPAVPVKLLAAQQWFASIITRPIDLNSRMDPISPSGRPMKEEAADYILPSPTLKPAQRIQIYNQQYWWRLINTMQDIYPLVTRLFGFEGFNQNLAVPYLVKYFPNHWSLNILGDRFPLWIEEEYHEKDYDLVYNSALVDWAYNDSFLAAPGKALENTSILEQLLDQNLMLQPHLHLFELPYDLFGFRVDCLAHEPPYWEEHEFPKLVQHPEGKNFYFVLYRNRENNIAVNEIDQAEFNALLYFRNGTSINQFCEWLEGQPQDDPLVVAAGENLHVWIQRWIASQWFSSIG